MTMRAPKGWHEGRLADPAPDDRAPWWAWLLAAAFVAFLVWFGAPAVMAIADTAPIGCEDYRGAERSACVVEMAR